MTYEIVFKDIYYITIGFILEVLCRLDLLPIFVDNLMKKVDVKYV